MDKLLFRPVLVGLILFVLSLAYYANAALNFPVLFNLDNHLNYAATKYIAEHHKIPVVTADDKEIYFTNIGTTRSLRPPFTFVVSAVASNVLEDAVENSVTGQRLGSSLIGATTVVVIFFGFWIAFSHIGLALLGATTIGLLPKFVFLSSCNNDDIGALLSVSVLFSSVLALLKYKTNTWVLIALAFSLGLVLQTKYTAWLTLPSLGLFCLALIKTEWQKVIKLTPILLVVCVASGGWWVLFNMLSYGIDDPSAMRYASELQGSLSDIEPNRQGYLAAGVGLTDLLGNHAQFLSKSYKSLVGYLEWIELDVGSAAYLFYGGLFTIGIASVAFRSRSVLKEVSYIEPLILLIIVIQCVFYVHHNLVRDVQPQARYILPIIMPLVYLFLRQIQCVPSAFLVVKVNGREHGFQTVACATLLALCVLVHTVTVSQYIVPAYTQKAFNTNLGIPNKYPISEVFDVESAEGLSYQRIGGELTLQRTGSELPGLNLGAKFCDRLPLNALVTMRVTSPAKGGLHIRIDRSNRKTYESVYWRGFPAGSSTAMFSINAKNCSGVKITLPNNTYQLSIGKFEISELRIHQYGKPI